MAGRILIADDVATNRIILKVKLAAASYEVWQVETAGALLAAARSKQPDLIIMDADLPDSDSYRTCRQLKNQPDTAAIPVVMVTANYNRHIRLAALRAGASEILPKPFDDQVLLARVRNQLRAHVMEEELARREGTAAEFGFHEAPGHFTKRPKVLLVRDLSGNTCKWQDAVSSRIPADMSAIGPEKVLEDIGRQNTAPDVIVLPVEPGQNKGLLTLVAELRSRRETRHSAIIVIGNRSDQSTAISALDIGANDLFEDDSLPDEIALRITAQITRKQKSDQLRATLESGLKLAATDPLTGLFNRRYALPHTARIAARSRDTGNPFAVMVLDLDRFKTINDTHGHAAGDTVLKEVAERLKRNLRSVDLICRIGGEEFLVVMPDTDLSAARCAAERLRKVTEAEPVTAPCGKGIISVTLSIGVSIGGLDGQDDVAVERILDRADQALLGAKTHGRNQVLFGQSAA